MSQELDEDFWQPTLKWNSEDLQSVGNFQDVIDLLKQSESFEWGIYVASDDIEHTGLMMIFDQHIQPRMKVLCIDVSGGWKGEKWGSKGGFCFLHGNLDISIHDRNRLSNIKLYVLQEISLHKKDNRAKVKNMIEAMLLCDPGKYDIRKNNCRDHVLLVLKRLSEAFDISSLHENMKEVIAALKEKDWKEVRKRLAGFLKRT